MQFLSRKNLIRGELGNRIAKAIAESKAQGTFKRERVIITPQGPVIKTTVKTSRFQIARKSDGEVMNMCSNNYLGLSNNHMLIKAAKNTLDAWGFGLSSVRFICGTQDIHKELETRIANFHGLEDCILFPSCFDANAGIFEALLGPQDAVFSDALNHASIIDGIRLCRAGTKEKFAHLDYADLETKLQKSVETGSPDQVRLIVTDGVFSMDGDIARLDKLAELRDKFPNTYLLVDDCHATGFLGKDGKGTPAIFNVQPDMINSTLGKGLGGATGGYTAASKDVVEMLRQKARPYLFSNSIAPPVVGASLKVMDILEGKVLSERSSTPMIKELHENLAANTNYFRNALNKAGLTILGNDICPIVPIMIGDANKSAEMAEMLLQRGIFVISFSHPVVPKDQARIRVQISATHPKQLLQKAVASFVSVAKSLGLIDLYTSAAFEKHTQTGRNLQVQSDDQNIWDDYINKKP